MDWVDRKLSKITSIVVVEVMSLAPLAFNNVKFHFYNESFILIFFFPKNLEFYRTFLIVHVKSRAGGPTARLLAG